MSRSTERFGMQYVDGVAPKLKYIFVGPVNEISAEANVSQRSKGVSMSSPFTYQYNESITYSFNKTNPGNTITVTNKP